MTGEGEGEENEEKNCHMLIMSLLNEGTVIKMDMASHSISKCICCLCTKNEKGKDDMTLPYEEVAAKNVSCKHVCCVCSEDEDQ